MLFCFRCFLRGIKNETRRASHKKEKKNRKKMAQHDLGTLARMLAATNGTDAYRSAVSTGTIFWALGVLREVLGLVAADHDEDREAREALVEVLRSWCTALRTRPRRIVHQGLLDRAAAYAVASFLSDVAEVRGASDPKMRELVDVTRAHVAAYESFGIKSRAVCFCRARGCERNRKLLAVVIFSECPRQACPVLWEA